MEYKFKLSRIHCAACALALEENINTLDGVTAKINFVTKLVVLDIDTENPAETLTDVKVIISKFDRHIELLPYEDDEDLAKRERRDRIMDLTRFGISMVLSVVGLFLPIYWLKIAFFAVAYLISSYEILLDAFYNLFHGKIFDETFLMTIASIGAFVIGEYFEAIAVVVLFGIGEMLEDRAVSKSKRTIKKLLEIKQPYANFVSEDGDSEVSLEYIRVGDLIRVKPGEKVPLDGVIVEGTSYLDMSAITGESKDKIVQPGDEILSGSINGSSPLLVRVTKLEKDSTVSRIIDLVQNAAESKAKSEKFISKFAKIYTPVVILLALVLAFVPPIIVGFSEFNSYLYRALCFLVVSCPCALVISVPLSYFAGIGALSKLGVLVKGANYLEILSKVDMVIFDKTGTLTKGEFEITEIHPVHDHTADELLEIVAYAESFSNHKIARSVVSKYNEKFPNKPINRAWVNDYVETPGKGISAEIFMQKTLVGNYKLLKENNVDTIELKDKPGTILYVAVAGEFYGYIVIADTVKNDSEKAIEDLKAIGIFNIAMSTGDEENVARSISNKLKINSYFAGLLPEDKVRIVKTNSDSKHTVAFVGDGINDAPSLAAAEVGIAMGGLGSDIAVEAADVIIMTDEPSKVAIGIKKARQAHTIIKQNIIGSIALKISVLCLVAFGLAGMWLAVFADVGVSLLAILNSLRIMIHKKEIQ